MKHHAPEHNLADAAKSAAGIMEMLRDRDMADDDELVADTVEGETGLHEALDAALDAIDACDVIVDGCKAKEDQLRERRKRSEDRREKIRAAIEQALVIAEVSEKIVRPTATFTLAKRKPGLVVDDESQVPAKYFTPQPPRLDKAALKTAAEAGDVTGCHMDNGSVSLTLRRK